MALIFLPVNFEYWQFAIITLLSGIGSGMFGAPNRSAIMNAVPASERGAASGVAGTVQNAGSSLSIGVFFSLMIVGLASTLPDALRTGLTAHHVPAGVADQVAQLPPVGSLFAAFLGYNPIQSLLGSDTLSQLPQADQDALVGKEFFPQLISDAFHHGLVVVFTVAAAMSLVGAVASLFRGKRYVHDDGTGTEPVGAPDAVVEEGEGPSVAAAAPVPSEGAGVGAGGTHGLGADAPGVGGSPA
ncbi:hypothetical protein GCM10025864_27360 [Luteimicrobium album]|uniref:MFS transporter n=1 Tax=Luteimicrobium album TaxID=1054550 RepID=A0ABQ6I416_9MICO|nr:hypothetical protein GCM10025864_27360 [Luteimicrobium album]